MGTPISSVLQGYIMLGISRFSGLDGSVRNDSQAHSTSEIRDLDGRPYRLAEGQPLRALFTQGPLIADLFSDGLDRRSPQWDPTRSRG